MDPPIKLNELTDFLCCPICKGYLINATTVNECLHTFCKTCIVQHIKNDNNECPKCHTLIHERRPLDHIMHDRNKQDIVYKLVPQLYITELYKRFSAREILNIDPITRIALEEKFLHVILVQRNRNSYDLHPVPAQAKPQAPIFLRCPQTVRVRHIRKLLAVKYQLRENDRIHLVYKGDTVSDPDLISNLSQSLAFCIQYEISRVCMNHQARVVERLEERN